MKKKATIGILLVILIASAVYFYIYKGHRDISTEEATFSVSIPELAKEFAANDSLALMKYQDKTIEITAEITAVDTKNKAVVLDKKVFATFTDNLSKDIFSGKIIKIKGRFLGYDELVEEYKMDQSSIVR